MYVYVSIQTCTGHMVGLRYFWMYTDPVHCCKGQLVGRTDDGAVSVLAVVHVGAVVPRLEHEDGRGGGPHHLSHVYV